MRNYQTVIMLLLTVVVGLLFIFRAPSPQDEKIAALETTIAIQESTLAYWEQQPTVPPASPTPFPTETPAGLPSGNVAPSGPVVLATLPNSGGGIVAETAIPVGSRIVSVQTAREVDTNGCPISPTTSFSSSDVIYGVVNLAEVQQGDRLAVQFFYETESLVIYEDTFTIEEGGTFCRWYVVEPDAVGWGGGAYRLSYQVNDQPAVELAYSVQSASGLTGGTTATEEAMNDQ